MGTSSQTKVVWELRNIDLVNIARDRERKDEESRRDKKELDLETQISIIRMYELLQVYEYFLNPPVISTHRTY